MLETTELFFLFRFFNIFVSNSYQTIALCPLDFRPYSDTDIGISFNVDYVVNRINKNFRPIYTVDVFNSYHRFLKTSTCDSSKKIMSDLGDYINSFSEMNFLPTFYAIF